MKIFDNMKHTSKILGLCLMGAVVFNACDNELDSVNSSKADKEVIFKLNIGVNTRTISNGLSTAWTDGDKVGIFSDPADVADNIELTRSAGKFSGEPVYLPESGSAEFYAYYPYSDNAEGTTFNHSVDIDQSAGFNHSDLLIAKGKAEVDNPTVELTFDHALALVEVSAKNIEKATGITIKAATESAVNLKTPEIRTQAGSINEVVLCNIGERIFRGIVPAQTLENSEIKMTMADGKTITCPIEKAELSLGSKNRFTLTIKSDDQVEVKFDKGQFINDWGDVEGDSDNWASTNINRLPLGTGAILTAKDDYSKEGWFNFEGDKDRVVEVVEDTDGFKAIKMTNLNSGRGNLATGYRLVKDIDINTTIEVSYEIKGESSNNTTAKFEMTVASNLSDKIFIKKQGNNSVEMNTTWGESEFGTYKKVTQKYTLNKIRDKWSSSQTTVLTEGTHNYLDFAFTLDNGKNYDATFHIRNFTVTYIGEAEQ